jgi:hypothetical protein
MPPGRKVKSLAMNGFRRPAQKPGEQKFAIYVDNYGKRKLLTFGNFWDL